MTQERIEAAAKAMEHHAGIFQVGHCEDHHHEDSFECVADLALAAADAVMFSEAVLEQAETAVSTMRASGYVLSRDLVAAVVAALKGDA